MSSVGRVANFGALGAARNLQPAAKIPSSPAPPPSKVVAAPTKSVLIRLSEEAIAKAQSMAQAADAGAPAPLTFDGTRAGLYEQQASTGQITQASGNSGDTTITLTAGKTYNFDSAFSYSYAGKKPKLKFTLLDANGKVVASSTTPDKSLKVAIKTTGTYTLQLEASNANGKVANNATLTTYAMNVRELKPKLPASSGNTNVDAVLSGNWWHDLGSVASAPVDPAKKITDGLYSLTANSAKHTLTYSFLDNSAYSWLSVADKNGFIALDTDQEKAVKKAFDYLSTLINVTFEKAASVASADITFGMNDQTASAGYALYPHANATNPSVLMLDNTDNPGNAGASLGTAGTYGWQTLVHELGHIMGLKHPGNYNAGGGSTPGPYLSAAKDNRRMALMSYNNPTDGYQIKATATSPTSYNYSTSAVNPLTFGVYDIAALQYLYGANTDTTTSSAVTLSDQYQDIQTVWSPKGIAVDASSTTRSNIFDLRGGAYSSVAIRTPVDALTDVAKQLTDTMSAAAADAAAKSILSTKSKIATATGGTKQVANSALYYTGKNGLGLAYGSSMTSVMGGKAADSFYVSRYSTTLDGGDGNDMVYLTGGAADWKIGAKALTGTKGSFSYGSDSSVTLTNTKTNAQITVRQIEAYAFYNDLTLTATHS